MMTPPNIYQYSDYRSYLRDFFAASKKAVPGFTWQVFAAQSGFSSAGSLKLVVDGKRNLGDDAARGVSSALRLKGKAVDYFLAMVRFSQSTIFAEKVEALRTMDSCRDRSTPGLVDPARREYLEHWYHPVIRELVGLPRFVEDPEWIASAIRPAIKPAQAAESLAFLETSGFLTRDAESRLVKSEPTLAATSSGGDPVFAAFIRGYHLAMMDRACEAVATMRVEERLVTNTTLSLTHTGYAAALERVDRMREELLELARNDQGADCIYQLTLNLFPLSRKLHESEGAEHHENS